MPQRTKKEKIAAQQRKALHYTLLEPQTKFEPQDKPAATIHRLVSSEPQQQPSREDSMIGQFFVQDLRKSMIFIVSILALEIFLHFARISNYFSR